MTDHVYNEQKFNQIHSFEGIGEGNHRPSDIDGFFDYEGRIFIFLEGKTNGATMKRGQEFGLTSLSRAIQKPNIVIQYEHETPEHQHVLVKNCKVTRFYFLGKWHESNQTVLELIYAFKGKHL